ncbi:HpcH/HpaI aldolase/citrate lyase family protein [Kordiimonas pumila]|uniref:HpcH/HpaI aldolase/citrate lyase family protein n=1 Tax=Kordiimonas pumila TaxID=2161677 RepID=A0ABV7D6U7_9PROT|nr:CoA ester lyase [Kordiimonas pumila]
MDDIIPRRSALFMPASNERALEKAKSLPCDVVIFDLEDAVSPDAKEAARTLAASAVSSGEYGRRELVIRINAFDTPWGQEDMKAAIAAKPAAILVPKVTAADDLIPYLQYLDNTNISLWAMMETPLAFLNAQAICAVSHKLTALVIGPNDLTKDLRARRVPGRAPIMAALSTALLGGRAYGKIVLDGVYNDFRDSEGFQAECMAARDMGFDGKTLIHPSQIEGANEAFAPSDTEVAGAERLIAAFEAAKAAGKGVATLDGKMIEDLHVTEARYLLSVARAITAGE